MKIRTLVATLLFSAGAMTALAQSTDSGNNCNTNSSISHEAVKAGNFKDAYTPWKEVMKDCPTLRYYTYTDGFDILKYFLGTVQKGTPEYQAYFDELMGVHDQLMQYTPEMQTKVRGIRSVSRSLALKAVDYIQLAPQPDAKVAYEWLKKAVSEEKADAQPAILFYFLQTSGELLAADRIGHNEAFIQDYLNTTQWVDDAIASSEKESTKKGYSDIKESLVALFINSGAADCASLQEIYAPQVEANKTNFDALKKIIDVMRMVGCTESEAYFQASLYSYQIEPTPEAAAGAAAMSYKKGDTDATVKYYEEAANLESDNDKKADYLYKSAVVLFSVKKYSQARTYANKALSVKEDLGAAHLLIAQMYGASPNWSDEPALNKCTYYVVLDRLNRAKAVDPSVTEEANRLIRTYSPHTPDISELFMLGYKAGDRITIGGWIGETTTIR